MTGPTVLEWPDYDGNSMYRSLGNALKSPRVGLLFIQFGAQPKRLRVNGLCTLLDAPTVEGHKMTVHFEADEIFPNCPRYIPNLTKAAASPFIPDETGASAKPDWKSAEDLRDSLPANDPHGNLALILIEICRRNSSTFSHKSEGPTRAYSVEKLDWLCGLKGCFSQVALIAHFAIQLVRLRERAWPVF